MKLLSFFHRTAPLLGNTLRGRSLQMMTIVVGGFLNSTQRDVEQLWREYKAKFGGQQLPIRPVYQPRNPNDEFGSLSEYRTGFSMSRD
jgi:hypothetical protein